MSLQSHPQPDKDLFFDVPCFQKEEWVLQNTLLNKFEILNRISDYLVANINPFKLAGGKKFNFKCLDATFLDENHIFAKYSLIFKLYCTKKKRLFSLGSVKNLFVKLLVRL